MLKRFIKYYEPHKKIFVLDMLASLTVSVIGLFYPVVTRRLVSEFETGSMVVKSIVISGLVLLALYFIRLLLDYFIQYKGHEMGVAMQANMRRDMFSHLERLPYRFYDDHETGKIMSRLTNDLFEISELAHHGPENLIISSVTVITSFIYLFIINNWLTLIIFACVPVLFFISWGLRKRMKDAFTRSRASIAEINAAVESSVSGIRVTKAFTNAAVEEEKFDEGNRKLVKARTDAYKTMGTFFSTTKFVTNVFNVVVLIAGGIFLYNGDIFVSDYSAFIVSVNLFITPVTTLINFMEQFQDGASGFRRFCEIMDVEEEKDEEDAQELIPTEGKIEFRNVVCNYRPDHDILHGVSMTVDGGKTLALVGPSGGGKTTICHLLPAFYDFSGGEILIDGKDIRKLTKSSLRRSIGIVQQDVYLFNTSIMDNIRYGRPDATDEEVIEAAKRANIHEFVMTLDEGYSTNIGERGVKLSGGQKQRLSIARVFLKNPAILILDEATSALDNATEIQIQSALEELCHGRTTIVVAHRLSTIKNADEIAVIEKGVITERGTHEELMAENGTYAGLYNSQFAGMQLRDVRT